jgi:hypothetical protein
LNKSNNHPAIKKSGFFNLLIKIVSTLTQPLPKGRGIFLIGRPTSPKISRVNEGFRGLDDKSPDPPAIGKEVQESSSPAGGLGVSPNL